MTNMLARQLLSIVILPFTMAAVVPWRIASRAGLTLRLASTPGELVLQAAGLLACGVGLALFAASLHRFATRGRGTLAPWDPPRHLVVDGPYRYVRNPMISGVLFIVAGEALLLLSWPHASWALLFLIINALYIPLLEEPVLEARFGDEYRTYCAHVRRFVPRLRPWEGAGAQDEARAITAGRS